MQLLDVAPQLARELFLVLMFKGLALLAKDVMLVADALRLALGAALLRPAAARCRSRAVPHAAQRAPRVLEKVLPLRRRQLGVLTDGVEDVCLALVLRRVGATSASRALRPHACQKLVGRPGLVPSGLLAMAVQLAHGRPVLAAEQWTAVDVSGFFTSKRGPVLSSLTEFDCDRLRQLADGANFCIPAKKVMTRAERA